MKVLIYSNKQNLIKYSGVGRARDHQILALEKEGQDYTLDPRDSYDLIHINTVFLNSFLVAIYNRLIGKTVVYHAHSTQEDFRNSFIFSNLVSPLFKYWIRACYRTADLILTPSNYSKRLLRNYGIEKEIRVISNGIDLSYWKATDQEKKEFRKEYGFKEDEKIIMACGLPIKRKGILDFIALAREMPDYTFIWFGTTNMKLVPREINKAIAGAPENCKFLGYIQREKMRVAYQAVDLFIFPSFEETEGIVLLEALASKAPTLVRRIPVFDDYEEDKDLYEAESVEEFKGKIRGIISGKLADLRESGYKKVSEKSIDNIGKKLKEDYLEADLLNDREAGWVRRIHRIILSK